MVPSNGWMRALLLDGNDVVKRLVLDTSAGNSVIVVLRLQRRLFESDRVHFFLVILDRGRNDR